MGSRDSGSYPCELRIWRTCAVLASNVHPSCPSAARMRSLSKNFPKPHSDTVNLLNRRKSFKVKATVSDVADTFYKIVG